MIYWLTKFDNKQSTGQQRAWIMVWLVFGQIFGHLVFWLRGNVAPLELRRRFPCMRNPIMHHLIVLPVILVAGVGAVGGFVMVARMMLQHEVCRTI